MCARRGVGDRQDRREIAEELGLQRPFNRCQHDAIDQATDDLAGLCRGRRRIQGFGELLDLAPIDRRQVRVSTSGRGVPRAASFASTNVFSASRALRRANTAKVQALDCPLQKQPKAGG